jgi:hypothetical protein
LAGVLRKPWILTSLPEALRAQVIAHSGSDIFAEIVNYLNENPEAELSQVVGRWAGEPIADELTRLAAQPLSLSDDAVASELEDGLAAYVSLKAREQRARLLSEIKEAPSTEKLQALRSLQQGSDAPKNRGQSSEN